MALNYYQALLSTLILVRAHIHDRNIKNLIFSHGDGDAYKLFEQLGVAPLEDSSDAFTLSEEAKILIEEIYYRQDGVKLEGIFSIVETGLYNQDRFDKAFDCWGKDTQFESYLDTFKYYYLDDVLAVEVFESVYADIFEDKKILNPVAILNFAERVTSDIVRGVLNLPAEEFKAKILDLCKELYSSGAMELVGRIDSRSHFSPCEHCQDVFEALKEMNLKYAISMHDKNVSRFWESVRTAPEECTTLLERYWHEPIFSEHWSDEEVIRSLEVLTNAQLFEFSRGLGSRLDEGRSAQAFEQELDSVEKLMKCIDERYGGKHSVRAGHFKQIARVLKAQSAMVSKENAAKCEQDVNQ